MFPNSLSIYYREISRSKPLTNEAEAELIQKARKGNRKAINAIIEANLKFVISVARNYEHQGLPLEDIISDGNLGLIKAIERFDETKNFRFISYAVWWIRQSILAGLASNSRLVRLPSHSAGLLQSSWKKQSQLEQRYQRSITLEEALMQVAEEDHFQRSQELVKDLSCAIPLPIYLDAPLRVGADIKHMDILKAEEEREPETLYPGLLDCLDPRERKVVTLYFGLSDDGTGRGGISIHTLQEIADTFDPPISRERVRQILKVCMKKLKRKMLEFQAKELH